MNDLEKVKARILSVVMDFIHTEEFQDYDNYSQKLSVSYVNLLRKSGKDLDFHLFYHETKKIKTNFFKLNHVKKKEFLAELFTDVANQDLNALGLFENFDIARDFLSKHIEIGFKIDKFKDERKAIIDKIMTIREPHEKVMIGFNELLQKITKSYQIDLHGVKEYSGIDICKKHNGVTLGFQIKTKGDDITENLILSETAKAQENGLNGFTIIYARKRTRKVDVSIQAAFHHFKKLIDSNVMYCSIIPPELLAELFRSYSIAI
ncbi:MAG: hypothetical protein NUK63_06305 [Candidatus Bathyarchaeum tardum]|nr:MAG: hypothetical protein NUK63_06305 [Candidatus Bathyarchaeum tardum]